MNFMQAAIVGQVSSDLFLIWMKILKHTAAAGFSRISINQAHSLLSKKQKQATKKASTVGKNSDFIWEMLLKQSCILMILRLLYWAVRYLMPIRFLKIQ